MNNPNNSPVAGFDTNRPTIVALLYLSSFLLGITGLIGLILAYVWRGESSGWETSHFTFHIRTFWFALLGSVISMILSLILIGIFGFLAIAIWMIIRTVIAMLAAQKRQPIANPETFLW